ncbi:MAG: hypothetical protein JW827_01575 [Spirochaetes bacterium]|nr:hypothetical protein [Spirochaetota bacterium]
MNINILEYLNDVLKKTRISELTVQRGSTKIFMKREPVIETDRDVKKVKLKEEIKAEIKDDQKAETRHILKSLTVGIFYRGKTKISPPLVKINSPIKKGDQVGMIDCMGVIEKVISDESGKIVEILTDNHKPVEYGQPLFVIEKE